MGILPLRGSALPYVHLSDVLGLPKTPNSRASVVVVEHNGIRAGIAVDVLLGEGQAVIKPLGKLFHGVSCTSGSTILGSGRVGLILDVAGILRRIVQRQARQVEASTESAQRFNGGMNVS